jgi:aldehyde:ferredoxin oxidoreductase
MEEYRNKYGDTLKLGDPIAISYGRCFVYGVFHSCTNTLKFWTLRYHNTLGWTRMQPVINKEDLTMRELNQCLDYIYGESMGDRVIKLNRDCLNDIAKNDYDKITKVLDYEYQNSWATN